MSLSSQMHQKWVLSFMMQNFLILSPISSGVQKGGLFFFKKFLIFSSEL